MLIETPYKKDDTITIKTSGGEEIIARFVSEDDNKLTVRHPMTLVATQQGLGLGPFAFTLQPQTEVVLNKKVILLIAKTEKEMAKQYTASTSGIQMV